MIGFIDDLDQAVFIQGTDWSSSMTHNNEGDQSLASAYRLRRILTDLGYTNFHVMRYPIDIDGNALYCSEHEFNLYDKDDCSNDGYATRNTFLGET